jgi:hypothetical protein
MATFKFDAEYKYGKLFAHLRKQGESKRTDLSGQPPLDNAAALVGYLEDQIDDLKVNEGEDAIVFRNISYEDFGQLSDQVRFATY